MMPEPKFKLGDHVEVQFTADVEGIPVTVRKPLVVTGVICISRSEHPPYTFRLLYTLREKEFGPSELGGKEYKLNEEQIRPIEPLINEMKKVKP